MQNRYRSFYRSYRMECLVIKMHVIVLVNMHFMNTIRMQRNKRSY